MSRRTKLALSSVVAVALVASLFGVTTVPNMLNGYHTDYVDIQGVRHISVGDPSQDIIPYHGVVTYYVRHAGESAPYLILQSHNTRTVQGLNCLDQIMFNGLSPGPINTNGTNVCGFQSGTVLTSAKFNGFRFIGLINGSGTATMNGSDTYTLSKIGGARANTHSGIITVGLTNQGSPANSTVAGTTTYNQITITSPAFAFTGDNTAGTTIRGAVLLNATSGSPAMFAENAFTGITLANTDTLTVTWTITVS